MVISWCCGAALSVPPWVLTPDEQREDVAILRDVLEQAHPSVHAYTSADDLTAAFDAATAQLDRDRTQPEFYAIVAPLVEAVGCGHTRLSLDEQLGDRLADDGRFFPYDLVPIGDRLYVDPRAHGVGVVEILSIDDLPAAEVLARLRATVASDGRTLATKDDEIDSHFPRYYERAFGLRERYRVTWDREGTVEDVVLDGELLDDIPMSDPDEDPVEVRWYDGRVFYVRIDDFDEDLWNLYRAALKGLREHPSAVLIDLRWNSGGEAAVYTELYRHFASAPFAVLADEIVTDATLNRFEGTSFAEYVDRVPVLGPKDFVLQDDGRWHLARHRKLFDPSIRPAGDAYDGTVVVLTSRWSASSAADFAHLFSRDDRGLVVGEETGGGAQLQTSGRFYNVRLPHSGLTLKMPVYAIPFADPDGPALGRGVVPDLEVPLTIEALVRGEDPVLDCALALAHGDEACP